MLSVKKEWTPEQLAFFNVVEESSSNVVNGSVAGSGKTTIICEAVKRVSGSAMVLCFNKSIAKELEERLPPSVKSSTFHAFCLNFIKMNVSNKVEIDGYKNYGIIKKVCPELYDARGDVSRLVGLMKNNGCGLINPNTYEFVEDLAERHDITNEEYSVRTLVEGARKVFAKSFSDYSVIDFDDMLYVSLKVIIEKKLQMNRVATLIVDELQDVSELQCALLQYMCRRLIGVGDKHQAIYAFRGAGQNSIEHIVREFGAVETQMTISWRCSQAVAREAQLIVPHFRARESAPEGSVSTRGYSELGMYIEADTMILCRNNFPLLSVALKLMRARIAFSMTGNYPAVLVRFVKSFKAKTVQEFRVRLMEWFEEKKADLLERNKLGQLSREEDKYMSLMEIQAECTDVGQIISCLEKMTQNKYGPKLTTIHSAKGLEARRVCFLYPELLPSKYAKTDDDFQQEDNLKYVGITRAIDELIYFVKDDMPALPFVLGAGKEEEPF